MVVEDDGESEDISLLEVPEEPPVEPALPSMPMVRRQVTCPGCGIKGHTYVKCPTRIKWQNLSYFCGISRGEKLKEGFLIFPRGVARSIRSVGQYVS